MGFTSCEGRRARRVALALAVALAIAAIAGCGSLGGDPKAAALEGSWVVEAFGGTTALEPADPMVTTDLTLAAGKASGTGGVNSYGGTYTAENGGEITFSQMASTAMAGPEIAMEQEARFFSALEKTRRFEFDGDRLVLSDAGNNTLVVLAPQ